MSLTDVAPRLAQALHAHEHHFHAPRLGRELRAYERAAVDVRDGRGLFPPCLRQRLDLPRRHAADGLGPLGRLGNAVLAAHDVVLHPVESHGVRVHVLLVEPAVLDPRVGYGQVQRHVGVGVHGNPLVGVHGSAVVHVGAHVDLLDAHLGEPEAPAAGQLSAPAPGRGLLVAAPVQQVVRVLGDVQKKVADVAFAHRVAAPDVLGAPVPPFPAVGVARLEREAAQDGHEAHLAAVRGMDGLRLAVAVTLAEHGVVAVLLLDAAQLLRDDVGGLVPRDALELALAAVARVALAIRVPVHALQGIQDAVVGIGALLVGERERRDVVFQQPFQLLAAHFQRPGPRLSAL